MANYLRPDRLNHQVRPSDLPHRAFRTILLPSWLSRAVYRYPLRRFSLRNLQAIRFRKQRRKLYRKRYRRQIFLLKYTPNLVDARTRVF